MKNNNFFSASPDSLNTLRNHISRQAATSKWELNEKKNCILMSYDIENKLVCVDYNEEYI